MTRPVLVVAFNPAVDVEWTVDRVVPGEKNEIVAERRWPGGKGINVARWLKWLGCPARLFLPAGGDTGRELLDGLRRERIGVETFPIRQATRANVVVTPRTGSQLRFNPAWPVLTPPEVRRMLAGLRRAMDDAAAVVLSGSLARGMAPDTYAGLVREAGRRGRPVFLDADGEAFRRGVEAGPFLVKPNDYELAQWAGAAIDAGPALAAAARRLQQVTRGWVMVSRGPAGAWLLGPDPGRELSRPARRVRVRNTVGAGDAMLAGVVDAVRRDAPPACWLAAGLAVAAQAVRLPGGQVPPRGA